MPTKTEQSDLLMALYGRHGESPLPVIAPEHAGRLLRRRRSRRRAIAVRYRTPVILLSDTFLASSSEPWSVPAVADLPAIDPAFATAQRTTRTTFLPYSRDERLARPWAMPGTPGLQHRIGGLEKADGSGNISYDAANHARMTELRAAKVAGIADEIPPLAVDSEPDASCSCSAGARARGRSAPACAAPGSPATRSPAPTCATSTRCPANTGDVLRSFDRVLVPEMNSGQLAQVLRAKFLVDVESFCKVQGQPLFAGRDRAADRGASVSAVRDATAAASRSS